MLVRLKINLKKSNGKQRVKASVESMTADNTICDQSQTHGSKVRAPTVFSLENVIPKLYFKSLTNFNYFCMWAKKLCFALPPSFEMAITSDGRFVNWFDNKREKKKKKKDERKERKELEVRFSRVSFGVAITLWSGFMFLGRLMFRKS